MTNPIYHCIYDITHIFEHISLDGLCGWGMPGQVEMRGNMLAFIWSVNTEQEVIVETEHDPYAGSDVIEITLVYDPNANEWSIDFYSLETLAEYGIDPVTLDEVGDILTECVQNRKRDGIPVSVRAIKEYCGADETD